MEHLGEGIAAHLTRVPYIVEAEFQYDYGGFHTFPDRVGWRLGHGGRWERFGEIQSCPRPGPLGSAAAFLQAWLFFGLLAEVLGPNAQLICKDLRVPDDHGSWWITTKDLPLYLHEWKARIEIGTESCGNLVQAQLALDQARSLVSKYCSVNGDDSQVWELDPMIALSFLVLGETLSHATSTIIESGQFDIPGWLSTSRHGWGYGKAVLQLMKVDNWCPRSIHILQGLLQNNVIGLLYAMRLSHPKALGLDHCICNTRDCRARENASYSTRNHPSEGDCLCRHVGPNLQILARHIRDGKLVVLEYIPHESRIKVVPYEDNMRYVILSHVSADGFGNSEGNTLPVCRLQHFIEVFERLARADRALQAGGSLSQPQIPIYFWIDTLAIPVGNEYQDEQRKAIQKMHKMYNLATYTIVLDAGLMTQGRGSSYAETAMKITTCYWITRLWTLQEAYLSKRLLFNFADALVDMDDLERMYKVNLVSPISLLARSYHLALLGRERDRMLRGRETERKDEVGGPLSSTFLTSLWNALQWRTTSHAQHETLALAIMLRINTEPFDDAMISVTSDFQQVQSRLDQKMQMLLSMIAQESDYAIPAELIFLPGPKLSTRGFRWAPRTWLNGGGNEVPRPLSSQQTGAQLTLDGLLLRCPGFKLYSKGNIAIDTKDPLKFPINSSLSDWMIVRDADQLGPNRTPLRKKSFAIVTKDQKRGGDLHLALLVTIMGLRERTIHAQILKRVWIRTEVDVGCIGELRKMFQKNPSDAIFGEAVNPNQQWCLDGAEQNLTLATRGSYWDLSNYTAWFRGRQIRSSIPQKLQS
jgi:hypothetical protein